MEYLMMKKMLLSQEAKPATIALRNSKSTLGNVGPVGGIASLCRVALQLEAALHGPCIHLHELLDFDFLEEDGEFELDTPKSRLHLPVEMYEARQPMQIVGVTSFGSSGTNVHHVIWGERSKEFIARVSQRPSLKFFPGLVAEPSDELQSKEGYFIRGTWTGFQSYQQMEYEQEGVYGFTMTLGDNRWETFQIAIDRNDDRVLHPVAHWGTQSMEVHGPDRPLGRAHVWVIFGRAKKVRLVNQVQWNEYQLALKQAKANGAAPPVFEYDLVPTYVNDYRPAGFENADTSNMPTMDVNRELEGMPGDKYRIQLHLRGKCKRVSWRKLPADAPCTDPAEDFDHRFFVTGDFNYWTFDLMMSAGGGKYEAEVLLLKELTTFQVVRDKDWDQSFYPKDGCTAEVEITMGPEGFLKKWHIVGEVGEVVKITFRRIVDGDSGQDNMSISWSKTGERREPNFEELAKYQSFSVVGSWTNFVTMESMDFDEVESRWERTIYVGEDGYEMFQILLNKNWLSCLHPSTKQASFLDRDFALHGPDDGGADRYFVIGKNEGPDSQLTRSGDCFTIYLEIAGGVPSKVWWEKVLSEAEGGDADRDWEVTAEEDLAISEASAKSITSTATFKSALSSKSKAQEEELGPIAG
eukprot:gnl/TRDRNA2_/TRDRNA2_177274_c3_seq1.p1 gnl/TRDRNA2_/TRDRNA2_177274_c3~~gnl/TRDRNA2_/TRDRNA2_177274_c3_seq1.p1  ORF type:complete len:672 (+),score=142.58 gnl/TRDRNA2_/TRDRNA2_177274_c3_seq1:108-2018(+)